MSILENVVCPECGGPMINRKSQYGIFWGCMEYPRCHGTRDNEGRSKAEREKERQDRDRDEELEQ